MGLIYKLPDYLKCPHCCNYMLYGILICKSGHSICKSCETLYTLCPLCANNFTDLRNYNLEQIVQLVDLPCPNDRCKYVTKGHHITTHRKFCKYGPEMCVLNNCSGYCWSENLALVRKHIETQHSGHINQWVRIDYTRVYVQVQIFDSRIFLIFFKYETNYIYYTCILIGSRNDAELYMMKLKFLDQTDNRYKLSVCGPCNSLCKFDEIFKSNRRVIFCSTLMKRYINPKNRFYECQIKIFKPDNLGNPDLIEFSEG